MIAFIVLNTLYRIHKKKVKIFLIKFIEEDNYYIQSCFLRSKLFAFVVKVKKIISSVEISPAPYLKLQLQLKHWKSVENSFCFTVISFSFLSLFLSHSIWLIRVSAKSWIQSGYFCVFNFWLLIPLLLFIRDLIKGS